MCSIQLHSGLPMRDVRPGDHGCLLAFPAMLLRSYGCRLRAARVVDYLFSVLRLRPARQPRRSFWHDLRPNTATRVAAFDHSTLAIRIFHNAGNTTTIRTPLAVLAALFDRLGRYEPAATIAEVALSPLSAAAIPEHTTPHTQPPR